MTCLKRTIMSFLLTLSLLPLWSQQKEDTTYLFRFVPGKDMFYVPWVGNQQALDSLLSALTAGMEQLRNGERYICVKSYAASPGGDVTAARMAYLRCHRIKSELIIRGGLTEAMFLTDRHFTTPYKDTLRNVVTVTFPASVEKVKEIAGEEAAAKVIAYNRVVSGEAERERRAAEQAAEERARAERQAAGQAQAERLAREQAAQAEKEQAEREAEAARLAADELARQQAQATAKPYTLALHANLLRWATLTPDLGVEWRIDRNWSVLVNGSWTSWSRDNKDRRYALWEVAPEVRYYLGQEKRGYLGALFKAGEFNYKFSTFGKLGDLMGGGITGGYRLKLNRTFALDFNLGIGCIHADYDKYVVIDGVQVKRGRESKNWWGPVAAGVTLMWKLF